MSRMKPRQLPLAMPHQAAMNREDFVVGEGNSEATAFIETTPGVKSRLVWRPIGSAGLYVPGGTAPLFSSLLMLAIPAGVAGVGRRVAVTPPSKDGSVHPAMIVAAAEAGLDELWLLGGVAAPSFPHTLATIDDARLFWLDGEWAQLRGALFELTEGLNSLAVLVSGCSVMQQALGNRKQPCCSPPNHHVQATRRCGWAPSSSTPSRLRSPQLTVQRGGRRRASYSSCCCWCLPRHRTPTQPKRWAV